MSEDPDDWRLAFLKGYPTGITFYRIAYKQLSKQWDHDHCMTCWAKFTEDDRPEDPHQIIHRGYTTDEGPWWICDTCFQDFKEMFGWRESPKSGVRAD